MIAGAGTTVKGEPLLAVPNTLTTTLPVVAPVGTVTTMLAALQLVTVAAVPLNVTVLERLRRSEVRPGDGDRHSDRSRGLA